ncbi:carbohydrate sulfotransferase 11-like [Anopheles darlingi]|uniref:carbohydrate sulfotransferase 11-like n=1 Tax=Anopheles darlingi TaxID=43151 RepID=UPI0021000A86|nr:carbohydrate sulfotransferase 11-like [Anopheles darlingi]
MIITNIRRLMRKSSKLCDGVQPARFNISNVQGAVTACIGVLILLTLCANFGLFSVRFYGQSVEEILKQRITHLETACRNLENGGQKNIQPAFYLYSKNHSLLYCLVFKAGTSTWFYNFNSWAGYTDYEIMHVDNLLLARKFYPKLNRVSLMNAMDHSFSFIIVRHPFERLISAFEDRMVSMRNPYYSRMSRAIYERYSGDTPGDKSGTISFRHFVQFIIDDVAYNKQQTSALDIHWAPMYQLCTVCLAKYHMIIKLETYARDVEVLIKQTGLQGKIKPVHINHGRKETTEILIQRYFSEITDKQMEALYSIYELDFLLFGYSAEKYFQIPKAPK